MSNVITVIPGDGIGAEVTSAVLSVLNEAGASLEYERQSAGVGAVATHGSPLPAKRSTPSSGTGWRSRARSLPRPAPASAR